METIGWMLDVYLITALLVSPFIIYRPSALIVCVFCVSQIIFDATGLFKWLYEFKYTIDLFGVFELNANKTPVYLLLVLCPALCAWLCSKYDKSHQSVAHMSFFGVAMIVNTMLFIDIKNLLGKEITLVYPLWEYLISAITLCHFGAAWNGMEFNNSTSNNDGGNNKPWLFNLSSSKKSKQAEKGI